MSFINYKIFPELELILIYYHGNFTKDSIKNHLSRLSSDPNFKPYYSIITDFCQTKHKYSMDEIQAVADILIKDNLTVGARKHAYIIKSSEQQATTSIYTMLIRELPMKIAIVTSKQEAFEWIELYHDYHSFVSDELDSFMD